MLGYYCLATLSKQRKAKDKVHGWKKTEPLDKNVARGKVHEKIMYFGLTTCFPRHDLTAFVAGIDDLTPNFSFKDTHYASK